MIRTLRREFVVLALATPFLVGILAFVLAGVLSGMGYEVLPALVEQSAQRRLNPLIAGGLGLVPVFLLLLILAVGPRVLPNAAWGPSVAWAGLIPVAALELWAHWEVWTAYLPSRGVLTFPHGLELVIVPIFFAPVGMVAGLGLGLWSAGRSRVAEGHVDSVRTDVSWRTTRSSIARPCRRPPAGCSPSWTRST